MDETYSRSTNSAQMNPKTVWHKADMDPCETYPVFRIHIRSIFLMFIASHCSVSQAYL